MACCERCFLDAIRKNNLVTSNFASHDFKIDSETVEIGQVVCCIIPSPDDTNYLRSDPQMGSVGLRFDIPWLGARLQTTCPISAVSVSILKSCDAKLDVCKLFFSNGIEKTTLAVRQMCVRKKL